MFGCLKKSCKTKSASPRKSPNKSPAKRKQAGYTRWTKNPVFLQPNGKLTLGNNRTPVYPIKNTQNNSYSGLYAPNDVDVLRRQLAVPKWNF